jgi:large subunit ribosomal protein L25
MKTYKVKAEKREETGKKVSNRLRKSGKVPCVLYGGKENVNFTALHKDFINMIYSPDVFLIEIDLDGKAHKGVVQEIQFHPVTDKILHIDFFEVFDDKPFIVNLPVTLTGSSIGIKNGGKLRVSRRYLKVKGLVKDMPDVLNIDITNIRIGETISVGDLSFKNLTLLDPSTAMIMGVVSSRVAAKGMMLEEVEGEGEGAVEEGAQEGEAAQKEEESAES